MRRDYEILGIEENADKKAVKKAYFKLIREYTPEKDPERFQEIRAAYERLTEEAEHSENSIQLEFPADDKVAKSMFDQIQQFIYDGYYNKALKTAEEGIRCYGEVECFLYMAAKCSILNDKSGKAVKAYEKLVERYPDKIMYRGELAKAYYMRGYTNKAYNMFREAYAEGWREYQFLTDYSLCCQNRGKFDEGIDVLKTYVKSMSQQEMKKNIAEVMNSCTGMFVLAQSQSDPKELEEVVQEILRFLDNVGDEIAEYGEMAAALYMMIILSSHSYNDSTKVLLNRLEKVLPEDLKNGDMEVVMQFCRAKSDERFGPLLQYTIEESLFLAGAGFSAESEFVDFILMDLSLCHLEAWPSQKSELTILRKEYPLLYELGTELWDIMTTSGAMRSQVKSELRMLYARRKLLFPGEGRYYDFYPDKCPNVEQVQWDSFDEGTFVRSERKIGRNEPCPCGSGKKYKNCCGKNK